MRPAPILQLMHFGILRSAQDDRGKAQDDKKGPFCE